MAQVKNYGLIGVGTEIQLVKNGPILKGNADADTFSVVTEGGSTLTTIEIKQNQRNQKPECLFSEAVRVYFVLSLSVSLPFFFSLFSLFPPFFPAHVH